MKIGPSHNTTRYLVLIGN